MKYNAADMTTAELTALQEWIVSLGLDPNDFAAAFEIDGRTLHLTRHLRHDNGAKYLVTIADADGIRDEIASEPVDVELTGDIPAWLRAHEARVTREVV